MELSLSLRMGLNWSDILYWHLYILLSLAIVMELGDILAL